MHALTRAAIFISVMTGATFCLAAQQQKNGNPTGSITGHVTIGGKPAPNIAVMLMTWEGNTGTGCTTTKASTGREGLFEFTRLPAGRYQVSAFAPAYFAGTDEQVFQGGKSIMLSDESPSKESTFRSVTLPSPVPAKPAIDVARNGFAVKRGERVAGLSITLAEGARIPAALRLHLIPAEKESAEETLRFAEVAVENDGTFALTNLAPGKYWVLARALADEASTNNSPRPMAWDDEGRKQLRKEGEAANIALELQPCQRLANYVLRYKKQ
ncbi:MAG TPA: carboxypeptidase-like regulatory domain-containing protein [Blastocatellia bacterium]|nr:carboxypeptidase-like regulatory domain-containing protein [Blastocatellia bacterium]